MNNQFEYLKSNIKKLGNHEVTRLEPLLPKCPKCGAIAEMRTASWTWVDYIICSKRCPNISTYPPKDNRYDSKSLDEIWESNLQKWIEITTP